MIDPNTAPEHTDSAVESESSVGLKPIPNAAAAADVQTAPAVPLNPDDLHDLFAGAPSLEGEEDEDPLAQLRADPNYALLIRDLQYIATQARLLFAPAEEEPSDDLWKKIQSQLPPKPENS